jgi:hypothetical protein
MISLFKRLFTSKEAKPAASQPKVEPINYNGYLIYVMPRAEAGQYRVAGVIEKIPTEPVENTVDNTVGNVQHQFIRSDLCPDKQQAEQITLQKCKLFIDQVGDDMFK